MPATPYKLIIFDFDGTLADTFPWFARVLNGVADRYRFRRIAPDEVEALRGHSARQLIAHLGVARWKLPFIARHMRQLAASDDQPVPVFPGIDTMLRELRREGFVLAIVSSNSEGNIRRALGSELAATFAHFACGAGLFGKTTKFRQIAKRAGIEHRQCLCIGDEIRDFEAASEAGMAFGAVSWGFTSPAALQALGPDFMFPHPDAIAAELLGMDVQTPHTTPDGTTGKGAFVQESAAPSSG
ncbi:MAG TPA: HAD hydrolase-like protein [Bosea sp. (in: a-proteobacteria)]|jgi:phosphoglycolate phosphatase|uniref:HAD hydrolase-like protein n=1 Tax=Bosea sp. (in: a-proteobacteria) TaxID=1871050 RepID=UPI002E0FF0EE|nr:HAD hydrolase-like protein [Bosea sp. (in: a-proteobacteria)]